MSDETSDQLPASISHRRRTVLGAIAATAGLGAVGGTTVTAAAEEHQDEEGDQDEEEHPETDDGTIHPVFGYSTESMEEDPPVQPDHEVDLRTDPPADIPAENVPEEMEAPMFPNWYFDPVGLYIEPGETVRFNLVSHFHTVTAYHPTLGFTQRVPDSVGPISSPVLWQGSSFLYTFEESGVYDLMCLPHEWAGMVIRIVAGEATGPGAEPVPDPQYSEEFPDPTEPLPPDWIAATVLQDQALDPENIIEQGTIDWYDDLEPESKEFPAEFLEPPVGGEKLSAVLSDRNEDVESDASGCAHFGVIEGALTFDLILEDIETVTQAHIHEGGREETGPVVAPLLQYTAEVDGSGDGEPETAQPDDPLIEAGVVDDHDLVEDILADPSSYYVNVHTTENPGGEIRGQIRGQDHI